MKFANKQSIMPNEGGKAATAKTDGRDSYESYE